MDLLCLETAVRGLIIQMRFRWRVRIAGPDQSSHSSDRNVSTIAKAPFSRAARSSLEAVKDTLTKASRARRSLKGGRQTTDCRRDLALPWPARKRITYLLHTVVRGRHIPPAGVESSSPADDDVIPSVEHVRFCSSGGRRPPKYV